MIKKLNKKKYNEMTLPEIENLEFDAFAYYGDSEYPMFIIKPTKTTGIKFFIPKTSETLKSAMRKLKNGYFKLTHIDDFKNRLKTYCGYLNIDDKTFNFCVDIYENKKKSISQSFIN